MLQDNFLKKFWSSNLFRLLIIVFLSCALLIIVNFFTIKILSAGRAYVNGESHYSKAQKDAVRHLIVFMYTQDKKEWKLYKEELKVQQGDAVARAGLLNNADDTIIRNGFLAGRNKVEDLDDIIWLFRNFKNVSFMAKAIKQWEKGDIYIKQLSIIGDEIAEKLKTSRLDAETRQKMHLEISILCNKLTKAERDFSDILGDGMHTIKNRLIYMNIFFILIMITSVSYYYSILVKRLITSKTEIEIKNRNLITANKELDYFVYSVSHDLRSPITSLKGLIELINLEDDLEQVKYYSMLMNQRLNKQDQFISDIIDYSKNNRIQILPKTVSLNKLIDNAIHHYNSNLNANKIVIVKNLSVDEIQGDCLRLEIILKNLISNALKYVDESKKEMRISIRTFNSGVFHKIEIADNGIGIPEEYKDKIFDMFFVVNSNKGAGLGLYIVKEILDKLNGSITVFSENKRGSKFIVTIPNLHLQEN